MRIFVLIISQVVVVVYGPRRGLKLLKDIDINIQINYCIVAMIPNLQTTWISLRSGCGNINGPLIAHIQVLARREPSLSKVTAAFGIALNSQ